MPGTRASKHCPCALSTPYLKDAKWCLSQRTALDTRFTVSVLDLAVAGAPRSTAFRVNSIPSFRSQEPFPDASFICITELGGLSAVMHIVQLLLFLLDIARVSILHLEWSSRESAVIGNHSMCQMLFFSSPAEQFSPSSTPRVSCVLALPSPKSLKRWNEYVSVPYSRCGVRRFFDCGEFPRRWRWLL